MRISCMERIVRIDHVKIRIHPYTLFTVNLYVQDHKKYLQVKFDASEVSDCEYLFKGDEN